MIRDKFKKTPHVTDLAMEHDGVSFVGALGDVVLLPLVRHDLPGYAEGCGRDQDSAAGDRGRHAHTGQRQAAPGSEWSQPEAEEGQRSALALYLSMLL